MTFAMCKRDSLPLSTMMSEGVGSRCNHWYVGWGLPSAMHSNVVEVKSGAVVNRSGPTDNILGWSETKKKS